MKLNDRTKGILWLLSSAFGFAMMSVFVRLAGDIPAFQKTFFRNLITVFVVILIMLKQKTKIMPPKRNFPLLVARSFFGTIGIVTYYYAIDHLLLADANMLNELSPFFTIFFSFLLVKERPNVAQLTASAVALLGSLFIIRPSFNNPALGASVAGLCGAIASGVAYTFVRKLGLRKENSSRIILFFSCFSCIVCIPFFAFNPAPMSGLQILYMSCAGICACIGQFGVTNAYYCAPAKEISVYDYTQLLFTALFGYVLFNQIPDIFSLIGYMLICGAGICLFFYNKNRTT